MLNTFKEVLLFLFGILILSHQTIASLDAEKEDAVVPVAQYKILCIDDSPLQHSLYKYFWKKFSNVEYIKAISADDAYQKLQKDIYDAVFLDYSMPQNTGGTGKNLLERIAREPIPRLLNKKKIFIASSSEESCNLELLKDFPDYICDVFHKVRGPISEEALRVPLIQAGVCNLIMTPAAKQKQSKKAKAKRTRSRSGDSTFNKNGQFSPIASPRNME